MFLLDTNVVSELRRAKPHGGVVAWLAGVPEEQLFVSAVTVGELQAGIETTREHDVEKATELELWLDMVVRTNQVLAMDGPAFREWARLMHHRSDDLIEDAMIAAIAIVHGLTVVTRNVKDFASFGVRILDPFAKRR